MHPEITTMRAQVLPFTLLLILLHFSHEATCDENGDKEKCANSVAGVAPCLAYVSGEARSPPIDCCTGLKQVLQTSPECICLLVKDRDDPSLGLKINATLALGLPNQCHAPANISNCPGLLHLAPGSPDAKVFEDFGKKAANSTTTTPPSPAHADGNSAAAKQTTSDGHYCNCKVSGILLVSGVLAALCLVLFSD